MQEYRYETVSDGIRLTEYRGEGVTELQIPETIDDQPVKVLGKELFTEHGAGIEILRVPGCVRKIEENGLTGLDDLKELHLSEGLQVIGSDFIPAGILDVVEIPKTVYRIDEPWNLNVRLNVETGNPFHMSDDYALYRRLDAGMLAMEGVFPHSDKKEYTIPDGCVAIEEHAFANQEHLETLILPASLKQIEEGALVSLNHAFEYRRGIRTYKVDEDNRLFHVREDGLYYQDRSCCELIRYTRDDTNVTIQDGVTVIGMDAFLNTPVLSVTLPESVRTINPDPFRGTMVEEVNMGSEKILFPGHSYLSLSEELLACFGRNGQNFDYAEYDRLVCQNYLNAERIRLFAARLQYPTALTEEKKNSYVSILQNQLQNAVKLSGEAEDTATIQRLCSVNVINRDNCASCLDTLSSLSSKTCMRALMEYSHSHFEQSDSDFSL